MSGPSVERVVLFSAVEGRGGSPRGAPGARPSPYTWGCPQQTLLPLLELLQTTCLWRPGKGPSFFPPPGRKYGKVSPSPGNNHEAYVSSLPSDVPELVQILNTEAVGHRFWQESQDLQTKHTFNQ